MNPTEPPAAVEPEYTLMTQSADQVSAWLHDDSTVPPARLVPMSMIDAPAMPVPLVLDGAGDAAFASSAPWRTEDHHEPREAYLPPRGAARLPGGVPASGHAVIWLSGDGLSAAAVETVDHVLVVVMPLPASASAIDGIEAAILSTLCR